MAAATVVRSPQQWSDIERETVVLQALQWAEVEGGPKSPLVVDAWYFVNRFTFLKVIRLKKRDCIGNENNIQRGGS